MFASVALCLLPAVNAAIESPPAACEHPAVAAAVAAHTQAPCSEADVAALQSIQLLQLALAPQDQRLTARHLSELTQLRTLLIKAPGRLLGARLLEGLKSLQVVGLTDVGDSFSWDTLRGAQPYWKVVLTRVAALPPAHGEGLAEIAHLDINNSTFESLLPRGLSGLRGLETLHIRATQLRRIEVEAFAGLERLKYIDVRDNELEHWAVSKPNPTVRYITAPDNRLPSLTRSWLAQFPLLEQLNLNQNRITELRPDVFGATPHLAYVELQENRLEHVPAVVRGLPQLKGLNLEGNQIQARGED